MRLGGLGGVTVSPRLISTFLGVLWAVRGGGVVYGPLKLTMGLRMSQEAAFEGADLSIHKIGSTSDREISW